MSDTSGVSETASDGSFSALLRKQESRLPAALEASNVEQTETADSGAGVFADNPLTGAIALLSALPHAGPAVAIGASVLQSLPGLRQTPGQSLGMSLPQTGNLLPPHAAGSLSLPQVAPFVNGNNPPASVPEPLAGLVVGSGTHEPAAGSEPLTLADHSGVAASTQALATEAYARVASAGGALSDAINGAAENVEAPPAAQVGREAVLAAAADPRPSSDMNRGAVPLQFFANTVAAEQLAGKPKTVIATFQSIHAEQWIGQGTALPDTGSLSRSADLQSMGTITSATTAAAAGGLDTVSHTVSGQQSPLQNLASKTVESPFGSGAWSNELADHVHSLARDGNLQRAELRLNPAHLGPIEVKVSVRGDETSITFIAAEGVVREALQETLPRLRDLLNEQGLNLGQARILDHYANSGNRQTPHGQPAPSAYADPGQAEDSTSAATIKSPGSDPGRHPTLIDAYI